MSIVVDSREPWERVFERLSDLGVEHQLEALNGPEHPKADYLVADRKFAIQRKEVNDFVSSIDSLKDDLFELRQAHRYSALLIEGDWSTAGDRIALRRGRSLSQTIPINGWHNFMVSQQLRGTLFLRTNTLTETCRVLIAMDEYISDDPQDPPVSSNDPQMMLQLIPGVGRTRAEALIEHYGSAYEAMVNVGQWDDEVNGVGASTVHDAIAWFKGKKAIGQ